MTSKSVKYADNQLSRFDPRFIQIGIVMDNRDPMRSGRLKIWILNSQSDKDSKGSWITASYLSPFAGRTPGRSTATAYQQFPKGYGMWLVPPDTGTTVGVFFANGNIHDAWWFGGAYDEKMNTMVPGSATKEMPDSGYDMPVPVTDYDRNSITSGVSQKYMNVPLVEGLKKQNLLYDAQKGVPNRSSTRQTTSTVYGLSSPRGSSIIIDDGYTDAELNAPSWDDDQDSTQDTQFNNPVNDTRVGLRKNEGIVFRTRSGAQILISESDGNVFIINRDGTARLEMTADGQIVAHSDKSITLRTGEDFNLTAARDINIECGRNFNMHVQNDSKLNLVNKLDITVGDQVVINTGAELRLVSASHIRMQTGASFNITADDTINTLSTSATNMKAQSFNISSSGTNVTIDSNVNSSTAMKAPNFNAPGVGLVGHSHNHKVWVNASNHSDEMGDPYNDGSSPNTSNAQDALPANDIASIVPVQVEQDEVQYINQTSEVGEVLEQDLMFDEESVTYSQSYEGLFMVMPCTGTIREFGYWGKGVPTQSGGKANRHGWIIQTKGDVVAPEAGLVTKIASGGLIITHLNGYKSIFYELEPSVNNQDAVKKGEKIGTAKGSLIFEIRMQTSNIYGFSGTVDPGLFYETVTGKGADAANKSLTAGKPSNPNATPNKSVTTSENSSELVVMSKVKSIGSTYSQRGSRHSPRRNQRRTQTTNNAPPSRENLSNINKTPVGWKVQPNDPKLVEEIKQFEGTKEYQQAKGFFRNNKFWVYSDSLGYPTIGYGHLITRGENFSSGLSEQDAETLLTKDLNRTVNDAKGIYAQYNLKTPYIVQVVLTEMVFQLGKGGTLEFKRFLRALADDNYTLAAKEMRNSAWYRQTTRRVEIMARRVEACQN